MGVIELQGVDRSPPNGKAIRTIARAHRRVRGPEAALRKRCSAQQATWQMIERNPIAWMCHPRLRHGDLLACDVSALTEGRSSLQGG